jgi:uncharacterized protein YdeI (YjbR/CyaY-like superfamily)
MEHFPDVDTYLESSVTWPELIRSVRPILLGCGLTEQIKWGKPCYSADGENIVILQEMKHFLALMFFKGLLLSDHAGVLESQGPNSRSAARIRLTSVADVDRLADTIRSYVGEAIALADAGTDIGPPPELQLVGELQARLDADPALAAAFASLTPGRRREYHLHISGAKHHATRLSRVDACADRILAGKGLRDR